MGWGWGGGAPMHDEQKLPDTRREKTGGGCTPGKKNFDPPGEAIFWYFWVKSPPGLLNKHPTEKNFSPPGGGAGEKFSGRRRRPENFFEDTPRCRPPPCPKTRAHLWLWINLTKNFRNMGKIFETTHLCTLGILLLPRFWRKNSVKLAFY